VEATSNRTTSITNPAHSLVFDSAGNTLSDNATDGSGYTATYNPRGQLATIIRNGVTTTYTYDADGRRVRKVSSTGPASNSRSLRVLWLLEEPTGCTSPKARRCRRCC
jgi:YD repeat-containing protein